MSGVLLGAEGGNVLCGTLRSISTSWGVESWVGRVSHDPAPAEDWGGMADRSS